MNRTSSSIWSQHLGKDLEFWRYGQSGRPVYLFPTSAGRLNENEDFGLVGALQPKIQSGEIQVFSLDSINRESWAEDDIGPDEKLRRHRLFDRCLAEELFPHLAHLTGRGDPILYGASLGGWQAATFGARHPELVGRVVAFSGFFDLRRLSKEHWNDDFYYFSPIDFVAGMDADWVQRLSKVGWVIATGETDTLVDQTKSFAALLRKKGIPVYEEVWAGVFGHDWPFWKEHLPRFVP